MSTSGTLFTSASLKAENAPPYSSMQGKIDPTLLQAVQDMGFDYMTPVQSKVLEGLPSLNSDCIVQAKTGTGKTTAFLLPALQNALIHPNPRGQVSVLILSPTRELVLQIAAEASRLVGRSKNPFQIHTAFGGSARASNLKKFQRGDPKVLVATPGRLNDYLSEEDIKSRFTKMRTLILDEADRMLDQGFLPDILKILRALPPKNSQGSKWQGMCFSATIPPKMVQVLSHVLDEDHVSISTIDKSEPPTLDKVPQYSIVIPKVEDTFATLFSILKKEIQITQQESKIIVFGTTANLVALYSELSHHLMDLPTYELHSRMSQPARTKATAAFKAARNGIMFATDVIGRGMDFPDVSLVVQVGLPADSDCYTHRVGRTARAGKGGRAVIFLTERESFFLKVNRQFPIQPYPSSEEIQNDSLSTQGTNEAMNAIDPTTKQKAYSAYLGFMKGFMNKLQLKPADLVRMANDLALKGMHTGEVPEMEKKTVGKMGLKGVAGLRYATPSVKSLDDGSNGSRSSHRDAVLDRKPKRLRG
ncbi:hypothetical protein ACLMJK_006832 [Lecanora helva]